jgi:3'(2'), 5'-bisphosphate nucleotidase
MTRATSALLDAVETLARQASALILQVYGSAFEVQHKADASPVTLADSLAEAHIVAGLRALAPDIPIVAEEAVAGGDAPQVQARFWLVDPLDGTREFVSRNGEFTVNIALIENGVPVLGVVHQPVGDILYAGAAGQGAWCVQGGQRRAIRCRAMPQDGAVLACSRSHNDAAAMQAWLAQALPGLRLGAQVAVGSSLKFGLIAAAQADVYPRLSRTMEWDTAAGDAVLRAAGGRVQDLAGQDLRYGKPGFENPHFVAMGA